MKLTDRILQSPALARTLTCGVSLSLLAAACSSGSDPATISLGGGTASSTSLAPAVGERGWIDGSPAEADTAAGGGRGSGTSSSESSGATSGGTFLADGDAADRALAAPSAPAAGGLSSSDDIAAPEQRIGLKAGSVDDNDAWEDYLRYHDRYLAAGLPAETFDINARQVVRVTDQDGAVVAGAVVQIQDGDDVVATTRTRFDGVAVLFPPTRDTDAQQQTSDRSVVVRLGEATTTQALAGDRDISLTLDESASVPTQLDLHFLIDATGSMDDEIERLKASLASVVERIDDLAGDPSIRLSLTAYRDVGDAFVTRTFDFTADRKAFAAALSEVQADGGGDYPEALAEALDAAVTKPAWRVDNTVSLIFLIADAPPQLDRGRPYIESLRDAARKGIAVFPVASSGLDDQGEFVFRQMALSTQGRFVFLTYGADGVSPGTETAHHVDDYSVLSLDDLIVEIVDDELGA